MGSFDDVRAVVVEDGLHPVGRHPKLVAQVLHLDVGVDMLGELPQLGVGQAPDLQGSRV